MGVYQSNSFFFHKEDFIFRNKSQEIIRFSSSGSQPVHIYYSRQDRQLISLARSPFGGFVLSGEANLAAMAEALNNSLNWALGNHLESITIHLPPDHYSADISDKCRELLEQNGFQNTYTDISQFIHPTTSNVLPLNTLRRRMLRKCQDKGFVFRTLTKDYLDEAYPLFIESRENKGYPVTMSLNDLKLSFNSFPSHYLLFGVMDGKRMIAACVTVVVNERILYYFFTGDAHAYRDQSPVTLLIQGIYGYCIDYGYTTFDLGISTDRGVLNEGLYSFKKSFGSIESEKATYKKVL